MAPHGTPGLSPGERLAARWLHYVAFGSLFAVAYGWLALAGRFPPWLLFGLLAVSLAKDGYDEYRLRRGGRPLAYVGVEHAPSNVVLLVLLLGGLLDPVGALAGVSLWTWAVALATADLAFDLSQDLRASSRGRTPGG